MSSETDSNRRFSFAVVYVGVILLTLAAAFLALCFLGGYSPAEVLKIIAETSYTPHQNIIFYIDINYYPLTAYLLIGLFAATFAVGVLTKVGHDRIPESFAEMSLFGHLRNVTVALLILMNIAQMAGILRFWRKSVHMFAGHRAYERSPFARPKEIATAFRRAVGDRPLRGQFISDLDISRDPGMLEHRSFAFFLYPVDIRNVYSQDPEAWVAYRKTNAAAEVPEGYTIVYQYDENNLIAVRKP